MRERDFPGAFFASNAVMKDETLDLLSSVGPITSQAHLEKILAGQWLWLEKYGRELYEFLGSLSLPPMKLLPKQPRGNKRTLVQAEQVPLIPKKPRSAVAVVTPIAPASRSGAVPTAFAQPAFPPTNYFTSFQHPPTRPLVVPSMYVPPWYAQNGMWTGHQESHGHVASSAVGSVTSPPNSIASTSREAQGYSGSVARVEAVFEEEEASSDLEMIDA